MTAARDLQPGDRVTTTFQGVSVSGVVTDVTLTITIDRAQAIMFGPDDDVEVVGSGELAEIPASPLLPEFVHPRLEEEPEEPPINPMIESAAQSEE